MTTVFNCDDILINFLVSNSTGKPPLLYQPAKPMVAYAEDGGLWLRPDHWAVRYQCLDKFTELMGGFMPLVQTDWSISRDVRDKAHSSSNPADFASAAAWQPVEELEYDPHDDSAHMRDDEEEEDYADELDV